MIILLYTLFDDTNACIADCMVILHRPDCVGNDVPVRIETATVEITKDQQFIRHVEQSRAVTTRLRLSFGLPEPTRNAGPDVKTEVIAFGTVISYARLNISVSRGAELATLSSQEFQARLKQYDVEPRFVQTPSLN